LVCQGSHEELFLAWEENEEENEEENGEENGFLGDR
jgi:hypothetical protein